MDLKIRWVDKYADVTVREGGTVIEMGLLDEEERIALARALEEAADELTADLRG